jgi:hypothetical protein
MITPAATGTPPVSAAPTALHIAQADVTRHLQALAAIAAEHNGIRAAGTEGYDASADYVMEQLTAMGYDGQRRAFDFESFDETAPISLTFGGETWTGPEWLHAALYSASGHVRAPIEFVGNGEAGDGCDELDWDKFTPKHVAVIFGGACPTRQKVVLAQFAGAVAVITLNPSWGSNQTRRPTLLDPSGITIPVIAAGRAPWAAMVSTWPPHQPPVKVEVSVEVEATQTTVDNVIAEIAGSTDAVVMLGAHLDSALDGPGINDNGTGVATLLAIASAVRHQPAPTATIRFAFWAAEEFGDLGSADYVEHLAPAERDRISAYFNLDMTGSPNPGRFVYDGALAPPGSSDLTQRLLDALAANETPGLALDLGGGSDHVAFELAGIPIGGLFSGIGPMTADEALAFDGATLTPMDPCYHLACDDLDNIDLDSVMTLGEAITTVIEALAY